MDFRLFLVDRNVLFRKVRIWLLSNAAEFGVASDDRCSLTEVSVVATCEDDVDLKVLKEYGVAALNEAFVAVAID